MVKVMAQAMAKGHQIHIVGQQLLSMFGVGHLCDLCMDQPTDLGYHPGDGELTLPGGALGDRFHGQFGILSE